MNHPTTTGAWQSRSLRHCVGRFPQARWSIVLLLFGLCGCQGLPAVVRMDVEAVEAAGALDGPEASEAGSASNETTTDGATQSPASTAADASSPRESPRTADGDRTEDTDSKSAEDELTLLRTEIEQTPGVTAELRETFFGLIEATPPAQRATIVHTIRAQLALARSRAASRSATNDSPPAATSAPPAREAAAMDSSPRQASETAAMPGPASTPSATRATQAPADDPTDFLRPLKALSTPNAAGDPTAASSESGCPRPLTGQEATSPYPCSTPVRDDSLRPVSYETSAESTPYTRLATETANRSASSDSSDDAWEAHIRRAIARLDEELRDDPACHDRMEKHAKVRLLHLLLDDRAQALVPIPDESAPVQAFWAQELFGLSTLLDPTHVSDRTDRLTEAKHRLETALDEIAPECRLTLRNATFCESIRSYGCYSPFPSYEFQAGQMGVYLYVELDNLRFKKCDRGYHTSTRHAYQIYDSHGLRVVDQELPTSEQYFRTPKRDYFTSYDVSLPPHLLPGKYTLMLTVIDVNGQETATTKIDFRIVSPSY